MSIPDKFASHADTPEGAPTDAELITPSDTEDLPFMTRFIRVQTGGLVYAVPEDKAATGEAVPIPVGDNGMIVGRFVKITSETTAQHIVIQN